MARLARYDAFGTPQDVVNIIDEDSGPLGPHDVLLGMEAACLHIADIYRITGVRPFSGPSPGGTPGAEGVGRATTQAVVIASVTILISDYFITSLLEYGVLSG